MSEFETIRDNTYNYENYSQYTKIIYGKNRLVNDRDTLLENIIAAQKAISAIDNRITELSTMKFKNVLVLNREIKQNFFTKKNEEEFKITIWSLPEKYFNIHDHEVINGVSDHVFSEKDMSYSVVFDQIAYQWIDRTREKVKEVGAVKAFFNYLDNNIIGNYKIDRIVLFGFNYLPEKAKKLPFEEKQKSWKVKYEKELKAFYEKAEVQYKEV